MSFHLEYCTWDYWIAWGKGTFTSPGSQSWDSPVMGRITIRRGSYAERQEKVRVTAFGTSCPICLSTFLPWLSTDTVLALHILTITPLVHEASLGKKKKGADSAAVMFQPADMLWSGISWSSSPTPLLRAGPSTAACPRSWPAGFWIPPWMDTLKLLWETTSSVCLPRSKEVFSSVKAEFSVFHF